MADFVAKVADAIDGGCVNVGAAVVAACPSRDGDCDALIRKLPKRCVRLGYDRAEKWTKRACADEVIEYGESWRFAHDRLWPVSTVRCNAEKRPELRIKRKFTSHARNDVIDPEPTSTFVVIGPSSGRDL
jgi:hypothetical protein